MQKALSNSSRRKWAGRNLALALTVAAVALTCACGGGSNPDFAPSTPSNPVPGVSLQRINITPSSSIIQMSESRQLFAQGVYSDGSTQDVSSLVSWSASSLPSMTDFVSVTSGGVATGMGIGATNITATIGSVTGIRTLTVGTNGFSSSTMAILSVPKGNSEIDAAYLPQQVKINGSYAVQEVNLDADQFSSLLPVPVALMASIAMPAGYIPNAAAGSGKSGLVAVISYSSPDIQIIDASNNPLDAASNTLIATYHSPVSGSVTINGNSCTICAAVVNPSNDQLILSTAHGFYSMNLSTGVFTQIPFTPAAAPSANITVNPAAAPDPFILSTVAGAGEIQILDLTTNAVTTYANVGVTPTAGVVDLVSQFSTIVDGSTGDQTLIDFTNPQTPVISTVPNVGVCSGGPAYMNMAALGVSANAIAANASHYLLTGQTGGGCVGIQSWPIGGSGGSSSLQSGNIFYAYGPVPSTPDTKAFVNNNDPNAIATFTSVFDKNTYGVLLNGSQQWLAKVNLATAVSFVPNWNSFSPPGPTLPAGAIFPSDSLTTGSAGDTFIFLPTPSTQLTLSANVLNFGTLNVGAPSPQFTVTLSNISQATFTAQIGLEGANPGDFSLMTTCPQALQPLTNCAETITFTPTAKGTRTAILKVAASGQPTQTVSLSGTGQ
jgi:centrosomal CEP192-like protein